MPVYRWKGVDRNGVPFDGVRFAPSAEDLHLILAKHDIGLLSAHKLVFTRRIPAHHIDNFFIHFSSLISASITASKALDLCSVQCKDPMLQKMIAYSNELIQQGAPLHKALTAIESVDELCLALIAAGEKSGDLSGGLRLYVEHRAFMNLFWKKMRAVLIGPLITFVFFIIITGIIFVGIIPLFEHYFTAYNEPLPLLTRSILAISRFARSFNFVLVLAGAFLGPFFVIVLLKRKINSSFFDQFFLVIPFLGALLKQSYRVRFFSILSVLLRQNVIVVQAIELCAHSFKNSMVRKDLKAIIGTISRGQSFSKALSNSLVSADEIDGLISIGESTGRLAQMVEFGAVKERELYYETITRYGNLVQPLIILLLGILIAALIVAIYMPILTFSSFIT